MQDHELKLVRAAIEMRSYHAAAWTEFLSSLDGYTDALKDQCVSATPDLLQQAQGRAQAARDIVRRLKEAPDIAEKLKEQGKW
jgi:hypothetical protein